MSKPKFTQHRPLFTNSPVQNAKRKMKWFILPIIWRAAKRMAMVLGFMVLLSSISSLFLLSTLLPEDAQLSIPDNSVLYMDFNDGIYEQSEQADLIDPFAPPALTLKDVVNSIAVASKDDNIKGMAVRLDDAPLSVAQVMELRAAIMRFKETEKFAYVYSTSYGGAGGGLAKYYLASMFDEIWMQPLGVVSVAGIAAEVPFFRGVLNKLGVTPQFFQREKYKTAYESLTNERMSPENRETLQAMVDDIKEELSKTIAQSRDMSQDEFLALNDVGLLTGPEALEAKLITHLDYGDRLSDKIAEEITGDKDSDDITYVSIERYVEYLNSRNVFAPKANRENIALIHISGAIMPDDKSGAPPGAGSIASAEDIAPAIVEAAEREDIKAIVLRVDSPGGSPSASERILRAVERAKEKGKPVIVSMGSMAASGGYWVSAYADRIFALPITITGSIGVVGGKFALDGVWDNVGVNWDRSVKWGKNSSIFSPNSQFSSSESERYNAMLDHTYESFLERVSKGRAMSVEEVQAIAGGRVWTGVRAIEVGLIDEFGGLNEAVSYAAESIGLEGPEDINVVIMPKPKTPLEQFVELLGGQVMFGQRLAKVSAGLDPFLNDIQGAASVLNHSPEYSVYNPVLLSQ